jgi:hypothetical protein
MPAILPSTKVKLPSRTKFAIAAGFVRRGLARGEKSSDPRAQGLSRSWGQRSPISWLASTLQAWFVDSAVEQVWFGSLRATQDTINSSGVDTSYWRQTLEFPSAFEAIQSWADDQTGPCPTGFDPWLCEDVYGAKIVRILFQHVAGSASPSTHSIRIGMT